MAQWKRAGLITQRSVDRNYSLLLYLFVNILIISSSLLYNVERKMCLDSRKWINLIIIKVNFLLFHLFSILFIRKTKASLIYFVDLNNKYFFRSILTASCFIMNILILSLKILDKFNLSRVILSNNQVYKQKWSNLLWVTWINTFLWQRDDRSKIFGSECNEIICFYGYHIAIKLKQNSVV